MEDYKPMKVKFETEDPWEIKRLTKANDMALFIWELVNNGWRQFKHTDYEYEKAWNVIHRLLEEYHIDPEDLLC